MVGADRVDLGYLRDSRACPFPDPQTQAAFAYWVFTVILRLRFAQNACFISSGEAIRTLDLNLGNNVPFTPFDVAIISFIAALCGYLLRYNKGDFLFGPDNVLLPIGTCVVALMDTTKHGWQCWQNGQLTYSRMDLVVERFSPVKREDLGDRDESKWEVGSNGLPRDPWQFTNTIVLISPESGDVFTFTTSSRGGILTLADLRQVHGRSICHSGRYPIVSLDSSSYLHTNKTLGRVKVPVLKVVGAVDARRFDTALAVARGEPDGLLAPPGADPIGRPAAPLELAKPGRAGLAIDDDVPF
jgi:hypothetical protein